MLTAFFLLPLLAWQGPEPATDSHIEFENSFVRIVRVHYLPHQKTAVHDHPASPTIYVYVTDGGRLRIGHDGEEPTIRPAVKQGTIRFQKGVFERHWVEELDGVESEYLRVELKTRPVDLPEKDIRTLPYESGMIRIERVRCLPESDCPTTERPAVVVQNGRFTWQASGAAPIANHSPSVLEQIRIELKTEPQQL